jgi:hypothetical protein
MCSKNNKFINSNNILNCGVEIKIYIKIFDLMFKKAFQLFFCLNINNLNSIGKKSTIILFFLLM